MSPKVLNWFDSYLSNRTQLTKVNNIESNRAGVLYGVPQGSILGPLIFILNISSLPDNIPGSSTFLYADNTAIVCEGKTELEVTNKLSIAPGHAQNWLKTHGLTLNVEKMKAMFFVTPNKIKNIMSENIITPTGALEVVHKFKYLGVMLDSSLKFNEHASYLAAKSTPS